MRRPDPAVLARAHGAFHVLSGAWPLLSMRTFEAVTGPKVDRWLVRAVGGLLITIGATQLAARDEAGLRLVRGLGIGAATTLGTIDVRYGSAGRISRVYLLDAVVEAGWVLAWGTARAQGGREAAHTGARA